MKNANCNDVCNATNQYVPPSKAYDAAFATKNCVHRQSKPWSNNCPSCVRIPSNVSIRHSKEWHFWLPSPVRSTHWTARARPSSLLAVHAIQSIVGDYAPPREKDSPIRRDDVEVGRVPPEHGVGHAAVHASKGRHLQQRFRRGENAGLNELRRAFRNRPYWERATLVGAQSTMSTPDSAGCQDVCIRLACTAVRSKVSVIDISSANSSTSFIC